MNFVKKGYDLNFADLKNKLDGFNDSIPADDNDRILIEEVVPKMAAITDELNRLEFSTTFALRRFTPEYNRGYLFVSVDTDDLGSKAFAQKFCTAMVNLENPQFLKILVMQQIENMAEVYCDCSACTTAREKAKTAE